MVNIIRNIQLFSADSDPHYNGHADTHYSHLEELWMFENKNQRSIQTIKIQEQQGKMETDQEHQKYIRGQSDLGADDGIQPPESAVSQSF